MLTPCFDILPPAQRTLWPRLVAVPRHFVLYGGTGIALRLGHRQSVDFDFFSDVPLDDAGKHAMLALPWMAGARITQNAHDTLTVSTDVDGAPVKLSFFGGLTVGCVAAPEATADGVLRVASERDLLAHKLKVIHNRAEAKDYIDIAALLGHGVRLDQGLADMTALFGSEIPPVITLKALTWFEDVDEAVRLTTAMRQTITQAVSNLPSALPASALYSRALAPPLS